METVHARDGAQSRYATELHGKTSQRNTNDEAAYSRRRPAGPPAPLFVTRYSVAFVFSFLARFHRLGEGAPGNRRAKGQIQRLPVHRKGIRGPWNTTPEPP